MPQMIESNPNIMMGKPVVSGTRVTVELILVKLGAGESEVQILNAHPGLTHDGVIAALRFAADVLGSIGHKVNQPPEHPARIFDEWVSSFPQDTPPLSDDGISRASIYRDDNECAPLRQSRKKKMDS